MRRVRVQGEYTRLQFNWRVCVLERPSGNKTYCNGRSKMKVVDRGCGRHVYVYIHYCVQRIAITARNPKCLLGHRRIFIQRAFLEMRDQIRSRDVRSKYTYSLARAPHFIHPFSVPLFHFNFDSKYHECCVI